MHPRRAAASQPPSWLVALRIAMPTALSLSSLGSHDGSVLNKRRANRHRRVGGNFVGTRVSQITFKRNQRLRRAGSDPSSRPILVANPCLAELPLQLPFLSPDEKIDQRNVDGGDEECGR
jgi:hypothetical protein